MIHAHPWLCTLAALVAYATIVLAVQYRKVKRRSHALHERRIKCRDAQREALGLADEFHAR